MNIFILDKNPRLSVIYHPDKHIVKMPLEATQLLCNALHFTGEATSEIYKPININHPCSKWARESIENWVWLRNYVELMYSEYKYRYGGTHKACELARLLPKPTLPSLGLTEFAKAVPDEFKHLGVIDAYRQYFIVYKQHLRYYTKREIPDWWIKVE